MPKNVGIRVVNTRTRKTYVFSSLRAAAMSPLDLGHRRTITKYLKLGILYKKTWLFEPLLDSSRDDAKSK